MTGEGGPTSDAADGADGRLASLWMPPAGWALAAFAAIVAVWWLADEVPGWKVDRALDMQLWMAAGGVALIVGSALPAVLLWAAPDVWWSDRTPLAGVILWTVPAALARLVPAALARFAAEPSIDLVQAASAVATACAYVGPLVLLIGLGRRRVTEASWPLPLVLAALAGVAALVVRSMQLVLETLGQFERFADLYTTGERIMLVVGGLSALELLPFAALAWMALSAMRAREDASRFWSLLLLASIVRIVAIAPAIAAGALRSIEVWQFLSSWNTAIALCTVASWLLFLLAFLAGVPEYVAGEAVDE